MNGKAMERGSRADPVDPSHETRFTYLPEGQQEKRIDKVNGAVKREVEFIYNLDYTLRSKVATQGSDILAQCNFAQGASSEADKQQVMTQSATC